MPCDYSNYPDNWTYEIRPKILERAGNCCEWCGVENYAEGFRDSNGEFFTLLQRVREKEKIIKIVLTIAHLDHDLSHNDGMDFGGPALPLDQANLVALCQRCHIRHDAPEKARRKRINPQQMELKL